MHRCLVLGMLFALTVGCGGDKPAPAGADAGTTDGSQAADHAPTAPDERTPVEAPTATFGSLASYAGLRGTVQLTVSTSRAVDAVELLADAKVVAAATERPFTLVWDTTTVKDGVIALRLKAHAGDASAAGEEVRVVVYNGGELVHWIEAVDAADPLISGEMTIDPAVDSHVKYHWTMPEGVERVIAIMDWDNAAFEMRLAIGVGGCPHSGHLAQDATSKTSPIAVDFVPPPGGLIPAGTWFAHAGADNAAAVKGQSTALSFRAYIFP